MARRSFLRVAGVIENMTSFTCEHGITYELFGQGGGQALASEIGSPLLGNIPIEAAVAHGSDTGEPIVLSKNGAAAEAFTAIAQRIINETVSMQDMLGCSARAEEVVPVTVSQRR
jgi:ATP-binding protein involved in chromosome partitioning